MSLLLYGVVWQGHPVPTTDHQDDRLAIAVIELEDLMVVAGKMPDDAEVTDEDAVSHLDTLVQLVHNGPVLPLRFGTVAPDADVVKTEVLEPAADELRRGLDDVRDLVELRIDLAFDEDVNIRAVYADDPEIRGLAANSGAARTDLAERIELGQFTAERLADRRTETVTTWLSRLEGLIERSSVLSAPEEGTERVALLVHRDRVSEVDDTVAALREEWNEEVTTEYVGPLPVFTFLEAAVEPSEMAESRWGW